MSPAEVKLSPTIAIGTRALELASQGIDVISLSAGEPDFPTPAEACEAGIAAIRDGFTKYTANNGTPELRRGIAEKLKKENGLDYAPDEILVSNGAKQAFFNALWAIVEPGDAVLIPKPYWVSYPPQIVFSGGKAVIVETEMEDGWRMDADRLREAVSPATRALVLNCPSNPTGAAYTREELEPIAEIALEHDLWIVSDDIYREITFDGYRWQSIAAIGPEVARRTIVVGGVSKSYSMTGWRIGWAVAPKELASAMARLQSQVTSGANSIAQHAALAAVTGPRDAVVEMVAGFARRRALVLGMLSDARIPCSAPRGSFYVFPDCGEASEAAGGTLPLSLRLMEDHGVATVPGEPFGAEGFLRLSFATSDELLKKGLERLIAGLRSIAKGGRS